MDPKPGYQTSEFWFNIGLNLVSIISMIGQGLPPKYGIPIMALSTAVYTIGRSYVKG